MGKTKSAVSLAECFPFNKVSESIHTLLAKMITTSVYLRLNRGLLEKQYLHSIITEKAKMSYLKKDFWILPCVFSEDFFLGK